MCGATLPLPQYVFIAWCLVKHRDNFTFFTFSRQGMSKEKQELSMEIGGGGQEMGPLLPVKRLGTSLSDKVRSQQGVVR
jgi:hypothetical protein